ncbi:DUF2283 domain-containing protein [bacterium]|nr:DUF2283 domain-containing protein [bacterium]
MRAQYFHDTDTLYIVFSDNEAVETKDFDENTMVDLDKDGHWVSITLEHAKERTDISNFICQQVAVPKAA